MSDRIKIDEYTERYLKYCRARAWVNKQCEDFQKNILDMNIDVLFPEKYNKAKKWLDKQKEEFQLNVCDLLDNYWMNELTQEERDQWMFENEGMVENG